MFVFTYRLLDGFTPYSVSEPYSEWLNTKMTDCDLLLPLVQFCAILLCFLHFLETGYNYSERPGDRLVEISFTPVHEAMDFTWELNVGCDV